MGSEKRKDMFDQIEYYLIRLLLLALLLLSAYKLLEHEIYGASKAGGAPSAYAHLQQPCTADPAFARKVNNHVRGSLRVVGINKH